MKCLHALSVHCIKDHLLQNQLSLATEVNQVYNNYKWVVEHLPLSDFNFSFNL